VKGAWLEGGEEDRWKYRMDGDIIAKVPLSQRVALETPSDEREITKPIRQKSHIRLRDAEAARALGAFEIDTYSRRMRGASATAPLRTSRTFYRTFYRPDRSEPGSGVPERPRKVAPVAERTSLRGTSKPVRRRSPTLGRFDSCAAP
jgi:hypothetical protein